MFKFLVALLITSTAIADVIPVSLPETTQYTSVQDAAVAGLNEAIGDSTKNEFAGAVFQCGDTYGYTQPVSNKDEGKFAIRVRMPPRCKLVGIFHTHPYGGDEYTDMFSPADVDTARALNVKSFIYVVEYKHIRLYDPNRDLSYTDIRHGVTSKTPGSVIG
jgi:hypothetical protein